MKIIIYGHARSGTTVLTGILETHPQIGRAWYEPFKNGLPNGFWKTKHQLDAFVQTLDHIFDTKDVIKSLLEEIPEPHLETFLKRPDKVILTSRKNVLRAAVSVCLGKQTNVWQAAKAKEDYGDDFRPLNIPQVKSFIERYVRGIEIAKQTLEKNKIDYFDVCYEDFFFSSDHNKRLNSLFDFLGLEFPQQPKIRERLTWLMTGQRLNTERTYLKIPNVYEIERELGNNETGWLLNGGIQF